MAKSGKDAEGGHPEPVDTRGHGAAKVGYGKQGKDCGTDAGGGKDHGGLRFGAGKDAAEQVIGSGTEGVEERQGDTKGIKAGTGADNQEDACKAEHGGEPACGGDILVHKAVGEEHDEEGGEVDDGDGFTNGHDAQGEHHGKGAGNKGKATQQDEAGALGLPECGTVAGAEDNGKEADIDEKADSKDKGHGVKHGEVFAGSICGGKQEDGERDEGDAFHGVLAVGRRKGDQSA